MAVWVLLAGRAEAGSVTVAWNANAEPDVTGYILSYGVTSGVYRVHIDVGNRTSYGVAGLAGGQSYFFVIRAYNTLGVQGPPSTEVRATLAGGVARLTVSPPTTTLKVGETINLTGRAFDAANDPLPTVPLTWSTANSAIVSLGVPKGATVPATAAGAGSTSVTVSSGTLFATTTVNVAPAPAVSRVVITPAHADLQQAQPQQFVALAYDSTNAPIAGETFTWTTSSSTVAPLGATTGPAVVVTPQAAGTATLTATAASSGMSSQATVAVAPSTTVIRVTVTPESATPSLGLRQTLNAVGFDSTDHPAPSAAFTWTTSNAAVARIATPTGGTGAIVAYGLGTATITATEAGGRFATTTITVTAADTLVWNTFSGARRSPLAPDANFPGSFWSISGPATPRLLRGRGRVISPAAARSMVFATIGTTAADARVAADWTPRTASPWGGIVLRWTDEDNFIFAGYPGAGELAAFRVRGGAWSRLAGAPLAVAPGTSHRLEAVASGSTIRVYWDGGLLLQASESLNQDVGRHGLVWANGLDTASGYDTFRVSRSPDVAAPSPAPSSTAGAPASAPSAPGGLNAIVNGANVLLQWAAPSNVPADSYLLEVGSASGLADLVFADIGTWLTSYIVSPVPPGTYYVRLRARGAGGEVSAASNEAVVNIGGGRACSSAPLPPPTVGFEVNQSTVMLDWRTAGRTATSYVIEAGSFPGASNLADFDTQSAATSYTATAVGTGTYFMRLRAKNACGAASGPSNEIVVAVGR